MSSDNYQSIIRKRIPSAFECLVSSISDMKYKGKKLGCELAAHEYEPILASIQQDYLNLEMRLKIYKDEFNKIIDPLIEEYDRLQNEKKHLNQELLSKQVPLGPTAIGCAVSNAPLLLLFPLLFPFSLTGIKQNAFVEAAEESYKETAHQYCHKITFIKKDFTTKNMEFLMKSENFHMMVNQILEEIIKEKIEIAHLHQLLQGVKYGHTEF